MRFRSRKPGPPPAAARTRPEFAPMFRTTKFRVDFMISARDRRVGAPMDKHIRVGQSDATLAPLGLTRIWTKSDAVGYGPPGRGDRKSFHCAARWFTRPMADSMSSGALPTPSGGSTRFPSASGSCRLRDRAERSGARGRTGRSASRAGLRRRLAGRGRFLRPYWRGGRDITSTIRTTTTAAIPISITVYQLNGTSMTSCTAALRGTAARGNGWPKSETTPPGRRGETVGHSAAGGEAESY